MDRSFDASKESVRVVVKYGLPNDRQITEESQRQEEAAVRRGTDGEKK